MAAPLLATATIGKTHGTEGYVRVYPFSDEYAHLGKLTVCTVRLPDGEELTLHIDSVQKKGQLFLMRFTEYPTPEKARFLSKALILIPRECAPALKKGEYYVADLYGMDVLYGGKNVGRVEYTMDGAQSLLLSVRRSDNEKEYLVPLLPVYVSNVFVSENTLELLNPDLLEL